MTAHPADIVRFWSHVNKGEACWEWQGGKVHGYGQFSLHGRPCYAHRLSYALAYGEIAPPLVVCHSCDNPTCVRPEHLWIGTHSENMQDKLQKGRQAKGATHGARIHPGSRASKLGPQQVIEIREKSRIGASKAALAREYGVSITQISRIVLRQHWKHI